MGIRYLDESPSRIRYLDEPKQELNDVEKRIASRPSAIIDLTKNPITFKHPLGAVLRTLGGASELYQGVPASIALDLQKGKPKEIWKNILKVGAGERPVQYGDVFRGSGVPEPLAAGAGLATDIAFTPGGGEGAIALTKGVGSLIKGGGKQIGKGFNYVKDAFTGGEKARILGEESKFTLRQSTAEQTRNLSQTAKMKTDIVKSNQDVVNQGYDDLSDTLKKMIVKESDKQSLNLQKDLPKLFSRKSVEYGAKKDALIKGKDITVPAKDTLQGVEDSLLQHGILRKEGEKLIVARAPMTSAEHEVYSLWSGTRQKLIENPNASIAVEDLMRTQKFMQPEFGRAWTPDDKLKSIVSKSLDALNKKYIKGYKELQNEYSPFLEWKNSAIDKLKPFSNKYDVETGIVSKLGSGKINPDEQRLMTELNDVLGKQIGGKVPALQKGLASIPDKKAALQQASSEVIKKMRSDVAKEIFNLRQKKNVQIHDIDQLVNKLVHQYKTRQLKIGIAGALSLGGIAKGTLQYFFRREIYSGMKSN